MMTQRPSLGKYGPLATVLLCALNGAITYWSSGHPLYGLLSFTLLLGGVLAIQWFYRAGPSYSMTWQPGQLAWLILVGWGVLYFWWHLDPNGLWPTLWIFIIFWAQHQDDKRRKRKARRARDLGI